MASVIHRQGMWQTAYSATDVLFPDGRRRTVKITAEADTFFSIPAAVTYRGTTVSGFIWHRGMATEGELNLAFTPTGKNAGLFPTWADYDAKEVQS